MVLPWRVQVLYMQNECFDDLLVKVGVLLGSPGRDTTCYEEALESTKHQGRGQLFKRPVAIGLKTRRDEPKLRQRHF